MWPFSKPLVQPNALLTVKIDSEGQTEINLSLPPDAEKQRDIIRLLMMQLTDLIAPVVLKAMVLTPQKEERPPQPPMRMDSRDFDDEPVVDAFSPFALEDEDD